RGASWRDCFFFSSRRRHTRSTRDWSSDVCSSDLSMTALSPDPQTLFTVTAPTRSGRPPPSAACLAGFWPSPAERTLPMTTSFTQIGRASCRERVEIEAMAEHASSKTYDHATDWHV